MEEAIISNEKKNYYSKISITVIGQYTTKSNNLDNTNN